MGRSFPLALSDVPSTVPRMLAGGLINHQGLTGQRRSHGTRAQQMLKGSTLATIRASIQRAGLWEVDYQYKRGQGMGV